MITIALYKCIKQMTFKILSREKLSFIPYKKHMFMFSWDPTLDSMQYPEHLKLLEYLLVVEHEECSNADGRRSIFAVIILKYESKCV